MAAIILATPIGSLLSLEESLQVVRFIRCGATDPFGTMRSSANEKKHTPVSGVACGRKRVGRRTMRRTIKFGRCLVCVTVVMTFFASALGLSTVARSHGTPHSGDHLQADASHCLRFNRSHVKGLANQFGQYVINDCSKYVRIAYGGDESRNGECIPSHAKGFPCVQIVAGGKRALLRVTREANIWVFSCFAGDGIFPYYEKNMYVVALYGCFHKGFAPAGYIRARR